jgi:anti-sigma factor RsiW
MVNPEQHVPSDRPLRLRLMRPPAGPCPEAMLLAAYVDGAASADEVRQVEGHLAACPRCLAAVAEVRDLLAAGPMLTPDRVAARAKALAPAAARAARGSRWRDAARWAAAAAAIAVVGYAGFSAGNATCRSRSDQSAALVSEASFGLADASDQMFPNADFLALLAEGDQ